MTSVRVFVSSPGDTHFERMRVERVVERLNGELQGAARLEAVRWEGKHYKAHATFQQQIPEAADCEIVIAILRHRMGTELPDDFPAMANGEAYPSGTAYEILSAIEARKTRSLPDVFVFRFSEPPTVRLDDESTNRLVTEQWERLKSFFKTWFQGADGKFKLAFHSFQSTDAFEAEVETLLRAWLEEKVLKGRAVLWPIDTKGSPFRGLAAFGSKHAPVFFGRSRDIARGVDTLKDAGERGAPFLLVVGASGAGKSSLALAGIVPRLTAPGVVPQVDLWRVAVMRPGEHAGGPTASLAARLFEAEEEFDEEDRGRPPALPEIAASDYGTAEELGKLFGHADETSAKPILRALDRIAETEAQQSGYDRPVRADLLIVIDQLDELFANKVSEAERARFARLLATLVATGRIWVIATLRADLYERFLKEPELLAMKTKGATYDLAPPGAGEIDEIIRGPADAAGLVYETDKTTGERLDERLIHDVDRPDMLPLLQFALDYLFEQRESADGETLLTFKSYDTLGGLAGAIDREAERAVAGLGKEEQERLPRLLRQVAAPAQIVEAGGAPGLSTLAVPLAEAAYDPPSEHLVRALVDARILLSSGCEQNATIRLAHQRVLENWKRAKAIVAANAEFYRIRDDVEAQRRRWEQRDKKRDLLIPKGVPLAEAESIAKRYPGELSPPTLGFIAASGKRARFTQRLIAASAVVFAVLAVGATLAGVVALQQTARAEKETRRAESNFAAALESVKTLVFDVAQGLRTQGMRPESMSQVLDKIRAAVDTLGEAAPDNETLLDARAAMLDEFTNSYIAARNYEEAAKSAAESLAISRRLVENDKENSGWLLGLSVSLNKLAIAKLNAGDPAAALALYEESAEVARKLGASDQDNARWQRSVSDALIGVGDAKTEAGDHQGALAAYEERLAILKAQEVAGESTASAAEIAATLGRIGESKLTLNDTKAAIAAHEERLAIDRKRADAELNDLSLQRNLALVLRHVGNIKFKSQDYAGALLLYEEGIGIVNRLTEFDPNNNDWQADAANLLEVIGDAKWRLNDLAGTGAAYEQGVAIARKLIKALPEDGWERRVSGFLHAIGDVKRATSDNEGALAAYEEAAALGRPAMKDGSAGAGWPRDMSFVLVKIGDLQRTAGKRDEAMAAFEESLAIRRGLPKSDADKAQWPVDVAESLEKLADVKLAAGDPTAALAGYEEMLGLYRALAADNGEDVRWQSGVAISLNRVGDAKRALQDSTAALAAFEEALAIRRRLAETDKSLAVQQTIAGSLETIGDVNRVAGKNEAALKAYEEMLALDRRAAESEQDNATYHSNVAVGLGKIGDVKLAMADAPGALASYEDSLAIRRRLAESDKSNAQLQQTISATVEKIAEIKRDAGDAAASLAAYAESLDLRRREGDVRLDSGDSAGALAAYEQSLALARRLSEAEPDNLDRQFDVSISLEDIAAMKRQLGDNAGGLAAYEESLAIRRRLAERDKSNRKWPRNITLTLSRIGDLKLGMDDANGALLAYQEMLASSRPVADEDQKDIASQRDLALALENVAKMKRAGGDSKEALAGYEESAKIRRKVVQIASADLHKQELSTAVERIGDLKDAAGDREGALAAYAEMLSLDREVAAANIGDTSRQRMVFHDLQKIADVKLVSGEAENALTAAAESLAIARHIALTAPNNADWKRDISISLERLGNIKLQLGDNLGSLAAFEESLDIRRKLIDSDGSNQQWRRDVSIALHKVGDAKLATNDSAGALAAYEESLDIIRKLVDSDGSNQQWRRDASIALHKVGDAKRATNDGVAALAAYEESVAVARRLVEERKGVAEAEVDLVVSLYKLAETAAGERKEEAIEEGLGLLARLDADGKLTDTQKGWTESFLTLRNPR